MLGTLASSLAAKRLGYDLLLESGAFRMSQREQQDAPVTLQRRSAKLVSPSGARPGHQSDRDCIFANLTLGSKTDRGPHGEC